MTEAAYRRLREDIVSCRLAPGARLTERTLAEEIGYGVSPTRAALMRLDQDGLVRTLPRRGYQVMPLTLQSIDDLFTVWRTIGPEMVRIGVRDADPVSQQKAITAFAAVDEIYLERGEIENFAFRVVERTADAFDALATATGNSYLIAAYRRLSSDMARTWALIVDVDKRLTMSSDVRARTFGLNADDWRRILLERHADTAAEYTAEYIAQSHERVRLILTRWPSVVAAEVIPLDR